MEVGISYNRSGSFVLGGQFSAGNAASVPSTVPTTQRLTGLELTKNIQCFGTRNRMYFDCVSRDEKKLLTEPDVSTVVPQNQSYVIVAAFQASNL